MFGAGTHTSLTRVDLEREESPGDTPSSITPKTSRSLTLTGGSLSGVLFGLSLSLTRAHFVLSLVVLRGSVIMLLGGAELSCCFAGGDLFDVSDFLPVTDNGIGGIIRSMMTSRSFNRSWLRDELEEELCVEALAAGTVVVSFTSSLSRSS